MLLRPQPLNSPPPRARTAVFYKPEICVKDLLEQVTQAAPLLALV
jgi:hypothetical protein